MLLSSQKLWNGIAFLGRTFLRSSRYAQIEKVPITVSEVHYCTTVINYHLVAKMFLTNAG